MTNNNPTRNIPTRILSHSMIPDLQELTSTELLNLFITLAKNFAEKLDNGTEVNELDELQVQIAIVKDELFRKSNISPEAGLRNNFFYMSLTGKYN